MDKTNEVPGFMEVMGFEAADDKQINRQIRTF